MENLLKLLEGQLEEAKKFGPLGYAHAIYLTLHTGFLLDGLRSGLLDEKQASAKLESLLTESTRVLKELQEAPNPLARLGPYAFELWSPKVSSWLVLEAPETLFQPNASEKLRMLSAMIDDVLLQASLVGANEEAIGLELRSVFESWKALKDMKPSDMALFTILGAVETYALMEAVAHLRPSDARRVLEEYVTGALAAFLQQPETKDLIDGLKADSFEERSRAALEIFRGATKSVQSVLSYWRVQSGGSPMSAEEAEEFLTALWLTTPEVRNTYMTYWENYARPPWATKEVNFLGIADSLIGLWCLYANLATIGAGIRNLSRAASFFKGALAVKVGGAQLSLDMRFGSLSPSSSLGFLLSLGGQETFISARTLLNLGLRHLGAAGVNLLAGGVLPPIWVIAKAIVLDIFRFRAVWDAGFGMLAESRWKPIIKAFVQSLPPEALTPDALRERATRELFPALIASMRSVADELSSFANRLVGFDEVPEAPPSLPSGYSEVELSPGWKELLISLYIRQAIQAKSALALTLAGPKAVGLTELFFGVRGFSPLPIPGLEALVNLALLDKVAEAHSTLSIGTRTTYSDIVSWVDRALNGEVIVAQDNQGRKYLARSSLSLSAIQRRALSILESIPQDRVFFDPMGSGLPIPITVRAPEPTDDFFLLALKNALFSVGMNHLDKLGQSPYRVASAALRVHQLPQPELAQVLNLLREAYRDFTSRPITSPSIVTDGRVEEGPAKTSLAKNLLFLDWVSKNFEDVWLRLLKAFLD